ncbi:MAG: UDP-N-acetylglucosamine--N-acetylmuramyl-(pentapeptide) pyrophosphoryl-undecaprenol N-acetylglucosamine transferase [Candidatus Gracilibacteria bacterium]|nr:UDP-N-acetylglucosamine--N-acetylmuramyl-(pentapeptide) pyrophosphoryl-undecaprenol N-acetylglucosamine transferase [Candidatus Gracilibacteria bacterium]MDQ7023402.1 UDP-N-acetylglucosamine--N-acetylmuramyl-(pentapeptide) pyrophosphoryl-undecaprenol N-acetylglucosamine transferase [Candidatus Gracilibacteria bacterium]
MKKTIALTGGGTGGHIIPLLSIYNYLKEEDSYKFLWIGEETGLEYDIAEENGIEFKDIAAGKIRRYFDFKNFYEPLKNFTGIFQGVYYIWKFKIDIIFSKGGFVSLPLCIAGKIMGKKIYIHESDIKMGLANKVISKIATKVFTSFPKEGVKIITTGQILNPELLDGLNNLELKENKKLKVLVIAGSQGSTIIFENLIKIIEDLPNIEFEIILGEKNKHFREKLNIFTNTIVHDFVNQKELGIIYKQTDIAITRGSATTLSELYYFGIHSIIIPITNAGNHQIYNAQYYKEKVGSDILDENKNLSLEIFRKLNIYQNLRKNNLNLEGFFDAMKIIEKEIKK